MRTRILSLICIAAAGILLSSCGNSSGRQLLPNVSGKAGEVIVVMDKSEWEGNLGGAVRDLLACDCPWLAQKEPLYSLVNISPSGFADLFKVHRNIVLFNIDPQAENYGVFVKDDVWASPQCVVYISAADSEEALAYVNEKAEVISGAIEQAERNRVIRNTLLYEERPIFLQVSEIMGGSPHFPSGYKLKKATQNFVWVADEKQYSYDLIQAVLLYKYPAMGNEQDFSEQNIIAHRNEILKANVPGMFENTWMTTSAVFPITVTSLKYKNWDFVQTRGYWEVENDYMGGPFVSHSFYSPDGAYVMVEDAFVYAPRFDKRQYLRQVESLLYSFEWQNDESKKN